MNDNRYSNFLSYSSPTDSNSNSISQDTLFGDPAYLDIFLEESKNYMSETSNRKLLIGIIDALTVISFITLFIVSIVFNSTIIHGVLFVTVLLLIIFAPIIKVFVNRTYRAKECIQANMENISDFFSNNYSFFSFNEFNKSFCINDGSQNTKHSSINKTCVKIAILLASLYYAIILILYFTNTDLFAKQQLNLGILMIISIFGLVSLLLLSFSVIRIIILNKICSQKVDAVCVDLLKKNKNSTPVFYFNYNNKGYIVYYNFYSNLYTTLTGDYISDMRINPDNPFEYISRASHPLKVLLLSISMSIMFTLPIILTMLKIFS